MLNLWKYHGVMRKANVQLGMTLDYCNEGTVKILMVKYIKKIIYKVSNKIRFITTTPASNCNRNGMVLAMSHKRKILQVFQQNLS